MSVNHVAVIGGGIGGLTSAALLAGKGVQVTLLERAERVGGKMREVEVDGRRIDSGPTVATMRWIFDELFSELGTRVEDHLELQRADILARHWWEGSGPLDLFIDPERSAEAIDAFAGGDSGKRYLAFCAYAKAIYDLVDEPFIRSPKMSFFGMIKEMNARGVRRPGQIDFHRSMWRALGRYFPDGRLRQLFGRYATYYGASPYKAPATLNLIAHVESLGVWFVRGGIYQLAQALGRLAEAAGAQVRCNAEVRAIRTTNGRVSAVELAQGETLPVDAVVYNGDISAFRRGLLGPQARRAARATRPRKRSLSAVTWSLVARTQGADLLRHNVFFSSAYRAEFRNIFRRHRLPDVPTAYICAQDRESEEPLPRDGERMLVLVNAPARGDVQPFTTEEIRACEEQTFGLLERCGLRVEREASRQVVTTPNEFEQLFPATGGALYGPVNHGSTASFARPGSRSRVQGLYLAGGSVHPGAGVPMVAQSGRLAVASLLSDLASTGR